MKVAVLSQSSPKNPQDVGEINLASLTESARLFGCPVYQIPRDFSEIEPDDALCYVPDNQESPGVFLGYVGEPDFYPSLYDAALRKGIRLINSPDLSSAAMEFPRFYPLIQDLTPKSIVLNSEVDCALVAGALGFPVFVKGLIKSRKEKGWKACIASSVQELRDAVSAGSPVIARQIAKLRPCPDSRSDFPASREYRVFLFNAQVLGSGFYWGGLDPYGELTAGEHDAMKVIAEEAARRISCPLMAVDVGQLESGEWIVI